MSTKEKRRLNPRIDFHHEVMVKSSRGSMKIMDFCTGGAFLQAEDPFQFEKGEEINIFTTLPLEEKPMSMKAEIVHIAGKGVGVKFLDLWGHNAEAIRYNFEVFKNTLPLSGT